MKNIVKGGRKKPQIVDSVSDSDDEEIPEDEAFNSDDERRYGSFFSSKEKKLKGGESDSDSDDDDDDSEEQSDSEDDDGIASDDGDGEGDGGQYMLDLLSKLDSSSAPDKDKVDNTAVHKLASNIKESEFASSVVRGQNLTIDSLMEGLEDTKGYGIMQRTMKDVLTTSGLKTTSAPVSKVVSDRLQRKVHYEDQTKNVSSWINAVKQNREAETLDFRPKERLTISRDTIVEKFVPTTNFEKDLAAALEQAGQVDEESILKHEQQALMNGDNDDDLGSNRLTMEEYKKRQGQLAKIRALMFYHEQKRHHMKKIKSKKYRRIRKKQRAREKESELEQQMEADPDLVKEMEEKEERERMQERATLAHKNTSKWAKRILKRGSKVDVNTRRALSAQIQRGDNLRRKMNSISRGDNSDDDDDDEDDDEDLVDAARKVLADTEGDDEGDTSNEKSGLFKLSFMQRGIERQRERAKEEARQLLEELEDNEKYDIDENVNDDKEDASNGSDSDYATAERHRNSSKKEKVAPEKEMKHVLPEGQLVATSLEFGNSNSISVSGGIDIELPGTVSQRSKKKAEESSSSNSKGKSSNHTSTMTVDTNPGEPSNYVEKSQRQQNNKKKQTADKVADDKEEDYNPWMVEGNDNEKSKKTSNGRKGLGSNVVGRNGIIDVKNAIDQLDNDRKLEEEEKKEDTENITPTSSKEQHQEKKIVSLTQAELVQRAFVTPNENEVEEEFAKEKQAMIERDDPENRGRKKGKDTSFFDNHVSGWGSWTGEGAPTPKPPKTNNRLQVPEKKKLPKRKRQDERKPNVIINEKRIKKTSNNYQIANIPYPYTTREEYERSMTGGVGPEWNVSSSVKNLTRPDIITRAGKIIKPLSKKAKVQKRGPAKF